MATQTPFLKLIKPLNNEYIDTWDQPNNANWEAIDTWSAGISSEITAARFGKPNLAAFLAVSINNDGTLKPTPEVANARNSFLYGDETPATDSFTLSQRLNKGDTEFHQAMEGYPTLRTKLAETSILKSAVISGSKDVNGYPTWMGFTGAVVNIDGVLNEILLNIDGFHARIRTLKQVDLTGEASGNKYIFATYNPDGTIIVDGDSTVAPPASANGICGSDGSKIRIFQDSTVDFTAAGVKVGDILEIIGTNANVGKYLIKEVAPLANVNQIKIYGIFPGGALAGINYTVSNPWDPTLDFDTVKAVTPGKLYLGTAVFDGLSVTSFLPLHFKDYFVGEWRPIDVGASPTFEEIWNHNLFSDVLEVEVQVSQNNTGVGPIEMLSTAIIGHNLGISVNSTLAFTQGTFNPGTGDATHGVDALTGGVTASLTGDTYTTRSALVKWDNNKVYVKNPISSRFYTDYSSVTRSTGYIRVIVKKRA